MWGARLAGRLAMEKIVLLCLIIGTIGVLAELSSAARPQK
jgi:hypothetical protein